MWFLRIPRERIAVLIGPGGKVKARLEKLTGVRINIDSKSGEVNIDPGDADPILAMKSRDMVKAIARGFSPRRVESLLNDEVYFEALDIREFTGKNPKRVKEMRGRVIGRNGRTRRLIEEYTEAEVSVYGNTIGIIGPIESMDTAKRAVEMLLSGSEHGTVYRYLEKKRIKMKGRRWEELIDGPRVPEDK